MKLWPHAACPIFFSVAALFGADPSGSKYELKPIPLPGANGAVALDYFAYDPATRKLWLPASNLGSVVVQSAQGHQPPAPVAFFAGMSSAVRSASTAAA